MSSILNNSNPENRFQDLKRYVLFFFTFSIGNADFNSDRCSDLTDVRLKAGFPSIGFNELGQRGLAVFDILPTLKRPGFLRCYS
jgi:hypothetical protein